MKKTRNDLINYLRAFCLIIVIAFGLAAIVGSGGGGGGDGGYYSEDNDGGWVDIDSYYISTDDTGKSYAYLSGTAFVSPDYVAHKCVGLCCLLCKYDDSYPGVDVYWNNHTSGITGEAQSRYGTITNWEHEWDAIIPLIDGSNSIEVTAQDPSGKLGSTSITLKNIPDTTPPKVISTNPVNNSDNIAVDFTFSAIFSEEIDTSTITTSTFTLSDISKNYVNGTVTYGSKMATFSPLRDLSPNTTYTATITNQVKDLAGVAMTEDYIWIFTTSYSTTPITEVATNITNTTAQLNGSIQNPENETTTAWFEYGLTPAYGFMTSPEIYSLNGTFTVSIDLLGLQECTTYYFRIVTENSAGIFYGDEKAFSTYTIPQIQILSSELNAPTDIQLDTESIYWVEIYGDVVKKVPINGGPTTIVASSNMWGNQASLAIDATHIYWSDWGTIWKMERVGGPVTILASGFDSITSLRVYSTNLYLRSESGIEKVDLETNKVTTLVPADSSLDFQGGLIIDTTGIYFPDYVEGTIFKTTLDGEQITTLATGLDQPHSLLLDSGFLFWAEREAIKQMSITGGTIKTLIYGISPSQIAKDNTNIYWTDYYGETINKVDLDTGAVVTLAEMQEKPSFLTVDENDVYWICDGNIYYPPLGSVKKVPKNCN